MDDEWAIQTHGRPMSDPWVTHALAMGDPRVVQGGSHGLTRYHVTTPEGPWVGYIPAGDTWATRGRPIGDPGDPWVAHGPPV